jgi:uncharacterized protein (DUF1330 family)
MAAYVIFDVEIRDAEKFQAFMAGVKPAIEQAGARYLARGGALTVHEGDWAPRRIVLLEFPSMEAWEAFYNGQTYQGLKSIRDECSSARLVSVVGL